MVKSHDKSAIREPALALDGVFGALSAEIRRGILARLRERPLVVAELAAAFDVSWPAISRHLKVLEEEGLVERRKDGRLHHIALAPGKLAYAAAWLDDMAPKAPARRQPAVPAAEGSRAATAPDLDAARRLYAQLAEPVAVCRTALGQVPAPAGGPASYLSAVLRRRLAADPGLAAVLADGCQAHAELAAALAGPPPEPGRLVETTFGLGQLAYALRTDARLLDLVLVS